MNQYKECECKNKITLQGNEYDFIEDEEPYENGKHEKVTEEESNTIQNITFYVSGSLCMKCKKVYFYNDNGLIIGIQDTI